MEDVSGAELHGIIQVAGAMSREYDANRTMVRCVDRNGIDSGIFVASESAARIAATGRRDTTRASVIGGGRKTKVCIDRRHHCSELLESYHSNMVAERHRDSLGGAVLGHGCDIGIVGADFVTDVCVLSCLILSHIVVYCLVLSCTVLSSLVVSYMF